MTKERSEKHQQARDALPEDLRPVFDQLVDDYRFAAHTYHGSPFVSYHVLAEIVKAGWRPSAEPMGQWKKDGEKPNE